MLAGAIPAASVLICDPTSAGVRTAGGFGRVVVADLDKGHLTVEHREMGAIRMPPMRMMFAVRSRDLMERLRPGDRIHFTIDRSDMAITRLVVLQSLD
jgi:Cu/Ag efflux protein CusF